MHTNKQTNKQTNKHKRACASVETERLQIIGTNVPFHKPNSLMILESWVFKQLVTRIQLQFVLRSSSYKIPYIIESKEFNPTQIIRCSKVCKYKKTMKLTSLSKVQSIMLIHEKNNNILVTSQQRKLFHLNPLYQLQ